MKIQPYNIDEKHYNSVETPKTKICLMETGFDGMKHIERLTINEHYPSKKSPHYTIDEDGTVYEHFEPKFYSENFDNEILNKSTITIAFVNLGWLSYTTKDSKYRNWANIELLDETRILDRVYRDCRYYHTFTKAQHKSGLALCLKLLDDFKIKREFSATSYLLEEVSSFQGIMIKANISEKYKDVNPSFDFKNFNKTIIKPV